MLHLITPRENFHVDAQNYITRPDIGLHAPSGRWVFTGICRRNNFGHVVERMTSNDVRMALHANSDSIQWLHKNGKPRWRVCDIDCGTRREWGADLLAIHLDW